MVLKRITFTRRTKAANDSHLLPYLPKKRWWAVVMVKRPDTYVPPDSRCSCKPGVKTTTTTAPDSCDVNQVDHRYVFFSITMAHYPSFGG